MNRSVLLLVSVISLLPIAFKFPLIFSGVAEVCEWYDDPNQCFRIDVSVSNKAWGKLFGYSGRFEVDWVSVSPDGTPAKILPLRVEPRE